MSRTDRHLDDFAVMVRHHQIARQMDRLMELLLDCETNERAYVITGDANYAPICGRAAGMVEESLGTLRDLLEGEDARQIERLDSIRLLAEARLAEGRRLISLRESGGFEAARDAVSAKRGQDLMEHLRAKIGSMRDDRKALMGMALEDTVRGFKRTNLAITVCGATALAGAAVCIWMLFLHLRGLDAQHALRAQREAALRADRAKSEFLAVMSHEIRTPMNSILGFGELLHDSATNPRDRKFAAAILASGNALLTLLNDILDISRIEAGKIEFHAEPVDLADLAQQLELLFVHRAGEKGLRYLVQVDPSVPPRLVFDPLRVRQVLLNLVGNALKFTSDGSVRVIIGPFQRQSRGEGGVLRFSVTDSGIGIPKEKLHDIFRPFFQVDSKEHRQYQGSGLGLSISRQLVAMMGGALTVESQPGAGSVFRGAIPVQFDGKPPAAGSVEVSSSTRPVRPPPAPTSVPGWDLAAHPEKAWRELLEALQGPLAEEAGRLAAVVPAKATLDFVRLLEARADHACWPLLAYATALAAQVESFDTEAAAARLRAFPRLAESLSIALAESSATCSR
jgi:signal transduction histidine kinase